MRTLSARQLVIFRAVAATIVSEGATPVPAERLDFFVTELRAYAASVGFQTRLAFRVALFAVQVTPLFLIGRLSRFTGLPEQDRLACLARLEAGPLGLLFVLLKLMVCLVYYEHPDALAATGYDAVGLFGPAHADGASPLAPLALAPEQRGSLPVLLPGAGS